MRFLIATAIIVFFISPQVKATAEFNELTECVIDKYFTKADALRIKVDELSQKETTESNLKKKTNHRLEKERVASELKKMREQKKAYDTLKKENFFNGEEGLKTVFPNEYEECLR